MKTDAKIAELEKQICELEEYFDLMADEIEDELSKGGVNDINTLLKEKYAAMMRGESVNEK